MPETNQQMRLRIPCLQKYPQHIQSIPATYNTHTAEEQTRIRAVRIKQQITNKMNPSGEPSSAREHQAAADRMSQWVRVRIGTRSAESKRWLVALGQGVSDAESVPAHSNGFRN